MNVFKKCFSRMLKINEKFQIYGLFTGFSKLYFLSFKLIVSFMSCQFQTMRKGPKKLNQNLNFLFKQKFENQTLPS